jgi:site-specific DNA-adenine methylase
MNKQIVKIHRINEYDEIKDNLKYWLSRPASERTAVVDQLRQEFNGSSVRFQRTVRIIQLPQS